MDPSTGVQEITSEMILEVFPNPATDYITFTKEFSGRDLKIYDTNGRLHYSKTSIQENERIVVDLADGIYIVQVQVGIKMMTHKLVVR